MHINIKLTDADSHPQLIKTPTADGRHSVVKYNRALLKTDEYNTAGIFRSLVTRDDRILICSPPKALPKTMIDNANRILACEFAEGVMVNVAWDADGGDWVFATKSVVGGGNHFYNNGQTNAPTMRDLFNDTCVHIGLSLEMLDKAYSYSFVMRHPQCRIVLHDSAPTLTIVHIYLIDGDVATIMDNSIMHPCVKRPVVYDSLDSEDLDQAISPDRIDEFVDAVAKAHMNDCDGYFGPGIMFSAHCIGGEYKRFKVRHPPYNAIKSLRDNNSNIWRLDFNILRLRREGRVNEYLVHYPEDRTQYSRFYRRMIVYAQMAFEYWRQVFIFRSIRRISDLPKKFRHIVYKVQLQNIKTLRPSRARVTLDQVIKTIDLQSVAEVLYAMNFNEYRVVDANEKAQCDLHEYFTIRKKFSFYAPEHRANLQTIDRNYNQFCKTIVDRHAAEKHNLLGESVDDAILRDHCSIPPSDAPKTVTAHMFSTTTLMNYLDWYPVYINFNMFATSLSSGIVANSWS